jgi:predicted transcriptional regulator YheO
LSKKEFRSVSRHLKIKRPPRWINKGADATTHFMNNSKGETVSVVCLNYDSTKLRSQIYALLIHEAVHVWQDFAESIGEHRPGKEQEAYAIQGISQRLIVELNKRMRWEE